MPDYNQISAQDAYGHFPPSAGQALTAASSGTAVGTVATGAIGSGTPTLNTVCTDQAGNFTVTGTAATGTLATVNFANPLPAVPKAVIVTAALASGVTSSLSAISVTTSGFAVAGTATAAAITVNYEIVA